jgi:transposase-like protein
VLILHDGDVCHRGIGVLMGALGGRQHALSKEQVAEALELYDEGNYWWQIAIIMRVSISTLMRYIRNAERYGYSFWTGNPRED